MPIQIKSEPRDETYGSTVAATASSGGEKSANSGSGGGVDSGSSSSTPTPTPTPTPSQQPGNNATSRPAATSNNQGSSSSSTSRPAGSYGSSASHSSSVGSGKASEKLSEEALEALEKRIDIASIKGVFGWTTIDGINIPFIFREDKKFVSVRIVEVKLFSRYPNAFPDELGKRDPLTSYFITEHEAKLLNEINTVHCSYEYGKQLFTTQDLIVNLLEFEQFHDIVKKSFPTEQQEDSRAQDMTLPRKSDRPQFMDYCGWLQINNTITPYVERSNGGKYVPLSVIRHAAGLLADNHITGDPPTKIECDMLNETCKVAGFNFSFCKSTKLVSLNTIKTYHNPLIINLPQDKPLTHARYIDFTGSTGKNSNFSPSPTLSAFPPPLQSSALSSTQAMNPFNTALPPYPRNPSPRGALSRSAITNNLINSGIIMQGGLGSNFLNFAKQQMPLKVPSASEPPSLQQRASYGTSNSVLNNSRLQPDQTNSNHHGVPNVGQLQQSKQHGGPLHVLKSFLNKGHVVTQSLPSISQSSAGQSVIQHQRAGHPLTSQPSQNVLVSQMPRFTAASITNPASLYASGGSLLSPLTPQSQWNTVIGSLPTSFADMTRYTQANSSTVRQPASSVSYPHPATNIPITTTSSLSSGHHPQNLYEQMLTISDSQATLGALAGLWTRPSENSSVSQVAAVAAQASIPSPNVMVSSGSSKPLPRTLAPSVTTIGAVVAPNHNSITANSAVPPSSIQPINLTSSSPVPTTNKISQPQQVGGAALISTPLPEPVPFAPFSTSATVTTDQPPQQQRTSKQADSALVQHISSIFLRGKSISCIMSPSRSGSYALVEAVCKLYYPQCSMNEFLFALENVLKVPLTACTDEEEKAFIQYYSLPVSVLKCNKMIKLSTLESHFPQLTYMFCKGQDASNSTTSTTTATTLSSSTTSSTTASSSCTTGLETNLLNATGALESEKNLRVSPSSTQVNNDSPTAAAAATATLSGLSSLASVTASSSLSSTNAAIGPIIVENDEDDVVFDCSRKSSPVVVVGMSSLLPVSNPSNGQREGTPSTTPNSSSPPPPSSTPLTNTTSPPPPSSSTPGTLTRTNMSSPLTTNVAISSSWSLLSSSSSLSPSPERTTAATATPAAAATANMSSLSSASSPSSIVTTPPPPPRFPSAASSPSNSSTMAASPPVSASDPYSQQASVVTMAEKAKTGSVEDPSPSPASTPTPPPPHNNNNSDGTYMAVPLMSLAEMQRLSDQQQKVVTNTPLSSLKRPAGALASGQSKFPCRSLEETVQRLHQTQNSPLTNATNMQICQTDSDDIHAVCVNLYLLHLTCITHIQLDT